MGCDTICHTLNPGQHCHFQADRTIFSQDHTRAGIDIQGGLSNKGGALIFPRVTAFDFPKVLGARSWRKGPAQRFVVRGIADRGRRVLLPGKTRDGGAA